MWEFPIVRVPYIGVLIIIRIYIRVPYFRKPPCAPIQLVRKLPQEAAASVGKAVEEEAGHARFLGFGPGSRMLFGAQVQKEAYMAAESRAPTSENRVWEAASPFSNALLIAPSTPP